MWKDHQLFTEQLELIFIIIFLLPPRVFLLSAGHFATCRFDIWYMTSVAVLGFETDPFVAYYFSLRSYLPSFVLTCYRYSSVTVKDSDIKPCAYYSIYKYDVLSYSVEGLRWPLIGVISPFWKSTLANTV